MLLLATGLLLWAATHLMVSMAPAIRADLVRKLGLLLYKGLFSLVLVGALALMIIGWRAAPATSAWLPPAGLRHLTMLLVPIAVVLFISARAPTDIRQVIRHPQLTGVKLWAIAHLLSNGEWRSLLLFGGLLAWAVLEVIFINRRDGARVKPPRVGPVKTAGSALVGLAVAALLIFIHPWLAGIRILPG
jgi:uncharacterized membrane protein